MELALDYDDTAATGTLDATPRDLSAARAELYRLIQEGIDDIENGRTLTEKEVLRNMEKALGRPDV
jgi:predicted transcriptional regulator